MSSTAGRVLGLRAADARARLARDGPNVLLSPRPRAWRQLAAQMGHFFALMLWGAGVLALIAGMPQLGGAIFVVVVVNGVFAFVQESAEQAAERLRDLLCSPRSAGSSVPGGVLQFADIANGRPVPPEALSDIELWTG